MQKCRRSRSRPAGPSLYDCCSEITGMRLSSPSESPASTQSPSYMLLTYMPTYAHQELGFSQDTANFATSVTLVCYIVSIFLMGHMSDSFGAAVC